MFISRNIPNILKAQRFFSTKQEILIKDTLIATLNPSKIEVTDTSGGCGAMYDIKVESPMFQGKTLVAQHKMVKSAIAEEIKTIHGLTVTTKITK